MNSVIDKKIEKLEKTSKEFWNVAPEAANFLSMVIKACNYKNVVEIGTSNGYSAIWISNALKQTNGHLTTIEYFQKRIDLAKINIEECGLTDYVTFKQGLAVDILNDIDFEIDMVFVDANKSEYLQYFKIIDKKLKKGGMIVADNITSHPAKVEDFCMAIKKDSNYQSQLIPFNGGILMAYKL
ncbi:MAG: class I SAM-dependent methyltransferase [Candidatus Gastranaerophilales bacterium]|nr:class I SAM-dependent methyltransferase [Candidatus Gastranaerophilales bacterium]